ncbi:MBL fold hydrolase [Trichlorobacter lovleyi]|uniref:MBL fold metallo-hydrolase n=1 Tax=Trichlorobacter lovleyi TaxID=313985 RepID=UPI0022405F32|nr:MBL fold metallo-hydrolase [Trichlorobacter lovleyi]QOX79052.1 MBL fold hydrolase [Trichlorobacter lovleyi]
MHDLINMDQVSELANGVYWVGAGTKTFLSRNSFLRIFKGNGTTGSLLIDPGPTNDLDSLSQKVSAVLPGGLSKLNLVFINHQDPDVVGVLPTLTKLNQNLTVIATEDTWRLVNLNGMSQTSFRAVDRVQGQTVGLPTGHKLQFIPTPFCHFRGACMIYDLESRILFTGDLFGGIAATGLHATEENWAGIKAFHQLYMPSNEAIRLAVKKIRALSPAPLALMPQHGGLIKGELMELFMQRMEELQVGLDIIISLTEKLPALIAGLNEILEGVKEILGNDEVHRIMGFFKPDGTYPALFTLDHADQVKDIKGEPVEAVEALLRTFLRFASEDQKALLQPKILQILLQHGLPPFDFLLTRDDQPMELTVQ